MIEKEKPATVATHVMTNSPRPRTLSAARQEFEPRKSNTNALAKSAGPIADYDANLRKQIDKRWRELVAKHSDPPRAGTVIVEFRLRYDGSVTEIVVTKNDVEEWGKLCRDAIEQAAPFGLWPPEVRRLIGLNPREVRFTFNYAR